MSATANGATVVYLPGIAGHPASSPALDALGDAGWDIVVPEIPGLDGRAGFEPPDDYLGWLTVVWDALDATGALPCPVVVSVSVAIAVVVCVAFESVPTCFSQVAGVCDGLKMQVCTRFSGFVPSR